MLTRRCATVGAPHVGSGRASGVTSRFGDGAKRSCPSPRPRCDAAERAAGRRSIKMSAWIAWRCRRSASTSSWCSGCRSACSEDRAGDRRALGRHPLDGVVHRDRGHGARHVGVCRAHAPTHPALSEGASSVAGSRSPLPAHLGPRTGVADCDGGPGPRSIAEVDGNRTRRAGITGSNRFEDGEAHQVPRHLRRPPYRQPTDPAQRTGTGSLIPRDGRSSCPSPGRAPTPG